MERLNTKQLKERFGWGRKALDRYKKELGLPYYETPFEHYYIDEEVRDWERSTFGVNMPKETKSIQNTVQKRRLISSLPSGKYRRSK